MDEAARQRMLTAALGDPTSAVYRQFCQLLKECDAADRRAARERPYVVVPFFVQPVDVANLEKQFDVSLHVNHGVARSVLTPRVAAFVFLVDSALNEHAGGRGKTVLRVDGDVVTAAVTGLDGCVVERTHATPRLAAGYFMEDDLLRRHSSSRTAKLALGADVLLREQFEGGGEHYWPCIREDGPRVDAIVVNHFKTPVGPKQLAWLAYKRGATVFGAIPFSHAMLVKDTGILDCFPGRFYIDRESDSLTLVPDDDATMSITHPYSAWHAIVTSNTITVGGREFLCEKYKSLIRGGLMYYTLTAVGSGFEAPEVLRTHYFDSASVGVVEISFPKVKLSVEGVPVGYERGKVRVFEERCEKALSRLMTSASAIVKPVEAFVALMDYNNTVIKTLDAVEVAKRMEYSDESDLALALALHVNWKRHAARGTFNVLLDTIKKRHGLKDTPLYKFAFLAITTWWTRPDVRANMVEGELPVVEIVDWCGNDFSVVMREVDPWIEIQQVAGLAVESRGVMYPWFPIPRDCGRDWYLQILARVKSVVGDEPVVKSTISATVDRRGWVVDKALPVCSMVDTSFELKGRGFHDLTVAKGILVDKLRQDQAAVCEVVPLRELEVRRAMLCDGLPDMPVPDVDIVSAIREDVLMCNRGVFDRDAAKTIYRLAETDIDKVTDGVFTINDAKRLIPKGVMIRYPKVDAGVESKRPGCQVDLVAAALKRNIGVPSNRGTVDLDLLPDKAVDLIISVCYRQDWASVVERHLNTGMWEANVPDIADFVANIDEKKVRPLLDEFFDESFVNLERWLLMSKGKVKSSREPHSDQKINHPQTIMYSESPGVNAIYSPMMRRFKECVDECLRPEISLNAQRSDEEHEAWYNSLHTTRSSFQRTYSMSADISCYDRSQEHAALRMELAFYRRHGLSRERLEAWSVTHGAKKAVSMMYGVIINIVLGGISGLWKTLFRNGIVHLGALVVSADLRREDIVMLDIKGDDIDAEFSRMVKVETTISRMSLSFNLSAKIFTNDVRYMCKSFRIKHGGSWYFVADPFARVQSLCTPLRVGDQDALDERWVSLKADLRHYDNGILVDMVAEAAQQFYGTERPLYGMARGLANIIRSAANYYNFFLPPVWVD